jgi:hypothetical protein
MRNTAHWCVTRVLMRSAVQCLPAFPHVFPSVSMRNEALLRIDKPKLRISTQRKRNHDDGPPVVFAIGPPVVFAHSLRNMCKLQFYCVNTA